MHHFRPSNPDDAIDASEYNYNKAVAAEACDALLGRLFIHHPERRDRSIDDVRVP